MEWEELQNICRRYALRAREVREAAAPGAGLFGWGEDPKKDPCHMAFYEEAEQWIRDFVSRKPGEEEAFAAARCLLCAAAEAGEEADAYWFLLAAQAHGKLLVPLLNRDRCGQLREYYDEHYPRRGRLPVQEDLYRLLKKRSG